MKKMNIIMKKMNIKELIKKEYNKLNTLIENCLRTIITYNYIKNIKFPLPITDIIYQCHKIENGSGIEELLDYIKKESDKFFNKRTFNNCLEFFNKRTFNNFLEFFKEGLSFE